MHPLGHRLHLQPIDPSHEQAIQALHGSSQAPSPIPQGKYVPGPYVPDRLQSTMEEEAIAMALASKGAIYLPHMMTELGFGQLFDSAPFFRQQHRRSTHSGIVHVQPMLETHCSTVLFLQRGGSRGEDHHPPRMDTETNGGYGYHVPHQEYASARTWTHQDVYRNKRIVDEITNYSNTRLTWKETPP